MANPTITADGSVAMVGAAQRILLTSPDRFTGDFFFEFSVSGNIPEAIGIYRTETPILPMSFLSNTPQFGFWRNSYDTNTNLLPFSSNAGTQPTYGTAFSAVDGDRLAIVRTGDVVRFYKNYTDVNTEPLWVSPHTPSGVYKVGIAYEGQFDAEDFNVIKARLRLSQLGFLYTAEAQTDDFGSTQASVTVAVAQESAIVGRGPATTATI